MDLFLTNMHTSKDVKWWTVVVWIIPMFLISCVGSHSDGTHSLQKDPLVSKSFNAKFLQICPDEETN